MEKNVKISLENVSFSYEEKPVLDNITFDVYDRDIITVVKFLTAVVKQLFLNLYSDF